MSETLSKKTAASDDAGAVAAPEPGPVSQWLNKQGLTTTASSLIISVLNRSALTLRFSR